MAPVLLPSWLGTLSRQLSRAVQHAPIGWFTTAGERRCITTITGVAAQARGTFIPVQLLQSPFRSPLLQNQQLVALQPSAGMKTKTALKKRCKDCFFVRRRGRLFVFCKTHPRHKQRQG